MSEYNNSYHKKYLMYKAKYLNLKYNKIGGGDKINVILFKADWCGHCIKFKPQWEEISKKYSNKYNFITYDADKDTKVFNKYKVEAFPTIMIEDNKVVREYDGDRTIKDISEFLDKLTSI